MEIKYLTHTKIDKKLWDKKIYNSFNSGIYALSGWLDIVSSEWGALVSNNYDFIMPVTEKKKYGIKYFIQPKFTQQTGIFSEKKITPDIVNLFLKDISKRYFFSVFNLNSENRTKNKKISQRPNYLLSLSESCEVLKKNFSKNTLRNIKKAGTLNLFTDKNILPEEAVLLKQKNNINNLKDSDLMRLKNLILYVKKYHKLKIYGVRNNKNELISVSVFFFYKNKIYVPLIASSEEGKRMFASFKIFNEFIKDHAGESFILDFEGSAIPGIARFFEGWGAKPEFYYVYKSKNILNIFKNRQVDK